MNKKTKYTDAFRQGVVSMVVEQGLSCREVGERLGTLQKHVNRWVRESRAGVTKAKPVSEQGLSDKVLQLEKEHKQLRMEREILKKAAAFFANESR